MEDSCVKQLWKREDRRQARKNAFLETMKIMLSFDIFKISKNVRPTFINCKGKWWGKYRIYILLSLLFEIKMKTGNMR